MKKFSHVLVSLLLVSCTSVKEFNKKLEEPIPSVKLKQDVDFANKKLQKFHPNLYWYITKNQLDYKFDSLKQTIKQPLKPSEFYLKLAPIIADVREGHLRLVPLEKKLTKKETKKLKNQKGLLNRFNYVIQDNHLYLKDNAENVGNLKVGTELLKINNVPVAEILNKYRPLVTSDGYNTTYQKYSLARRFNTYFTLEYGILDSVKIETKQKDSIQTLVLKRETKTKTEKKKEKQDQKLTQEKKTKGYNPITKSFNRNLQFLAKDSSVAYIKIKSFSGTYSKKFYKETFATLKKAKTKYLIIDIRDNLGGSLAEINNLYTYFAKEKFKFIKDIEVSSRTSILSTDYLSNFPTFTKPLGIISYPLYMMFSVISTKKKDGKFYIKDLFPSKKPKTNAYNGETYVLINGSSFSASSVISAKLKADHLATLVGEETGGANDGTVAGIYTTQKLPNSKMKLPIGLFLIQPNIEFSNTMKGVTPNVEIIPTLEEVLQKKDVQLNWILNDISSKKTSQK
ncbi:S41 family peptidase [Cloacibacterium sp.]|uniref:S41 family peptidase n=1 Tax=Cloacibacterium sp. TaxID=1913682 RepID=UPI0039E65EB5